MTTQYVVLVRSDDGIDRCSRLHRSNESSRARQEQRIDCYADPAGRQLGTINHHDGGRGAYFADPSGHWMEIITRPYGSSA